MEPEERPKVFKRFLYAHRKIGTSIFKISASNSPPERFVKGKLRYMCSDLFYIQLTDDAFDLKREKKTDLIIELGNDSRARHFGYDFFFWREGTEELLTGKDFKKYPQVQKPEKIPSTKTQERSAKTLQKSVEKMKEKEISLLEGSSEKVSLLKGHPDEKMLLILVKEFKTALVDFGVPVDEEIDMEMMVLFFLSNDYLTPLILIIFGSKIYKYWDQLSPVLQKIKERILKNIH